jgi:hypothetical protein
MADEYQTTRAHVRFGDAATKSCGYDPAPLPPPGDGWQLVSSSTVTKPGVLDGFLVLWFWRRRDVKKKYSGCPDPKCNALARKDGRCVGCGAEVANA